MEDTILVENIETDFVHELVSLTRLVTYARNCARDLKVEMPSYCLDMALSALLTEVEKHGLSINEVTTKDSYGIPAAFH